MKQEKWITAILCILLILGAGVWYLYHGQGTTGSEVVFATEMPLASAVDNNRSAHSNPSAAPQETQAEYAVYICGEVKHPGVYRFTQAARICDVVEAAGGFTKKAATASVNQARYITDGEQIEIMSEKQWRKSSGQTQAGFPSENNNNTMQDSGKVNLNTATEAELMTLSGVGQSKAKAIIDYRTQNGPFGSVEDIMQVPGIK